MSSAGNDSEEPEFCWGKKRGVGKNKDVQFYESFTYDGEEYALYDCVYMYNEKDVDHPYIGKLIRIWENADKTKKIKVQWFFRASEISYWLEHHNVEASAKELFLASGEGRGLANVNPLEVIVQKCSVVCISRDSRNPQPSPELLRKAEFVFHRTFDVARHVILDKMDDRVGGLEVKYLFNQQEIEMITGPKICSKPKEEDSRITVVFEENLHQVVKSIKNDGDHNGLVAEKDGEANNLLDKDGGREVNLKKSNVDSVKEKRKPDSGKDLFRVTEEARFDNGYNSLNDRPSKVFKGEGTGKLSEVKKRSHIEEPTNAKAKGVIKEKNFSLNQEDVKIPTVGSLKDRRNSNIVKAEVKGTKFVEGPSFLDDRPSKKPKVEGSVQLFKVEKKKCVDKGSSVGIKGLDLAPTKENPRWKSSEPVVGPSKEKLYKMGSVLTGYNSTKTETSLDVGKIYQVTQKPNNENKWFTSIPWEENMKVAHNERRLILLQNLDPQYTSGEVEDILWSAFKEKCTAKMVQHTAFSPPHYGQALVIVKTQETAERVVSELSTGCLLISKQRVLIASTVSLPQPIRKQCNFVGHLILDKMKHQMQRDQKDARSTSHYSQANTIEYEFAMEWCLLQERYDLCWKSLHKCQGAALSKCLASFKSNARNKI